MNLRKVCIYLLAAAAATAYATNQYQIRTETEIMARHLAAQIKAVGDTNILRRQTQNYENTVNGIADKN